jgi:carboxypeptidase C (cathepsin A)
MRIATYRTASVSNRWLTIVAAGALALPVAAQTQSTHPWFAPTLVDDSPAAPFVRTHHNGLFNGESIEFDALTGETVLLDENGQPATTVFSTAYIRTDVHDTASRPVLFLFNGGPGASSSPLHLGVGPVRRPLSENGDALVANPSSVLDAADLVFVDPPGTGYSRLYREGAGETFWGNERDADAILFFVHDWLTREDRLDSPVFVVGESYGATRAVTMLERAGNVNFAGALLLSTTLGYRSGTADADDNLPYIVRLPSMAATAAYHGVTERRGRSIETIFAQAADYARSRYAPALKQDAAIDNADRGEIAAELAALTGLSRDYLAERDLKVSVQEFSDALLGDQGIRVGRLDARITGPIAEFRGRRPPRDDPSMGAGGSGGRSTGELLDEYFKERLNTDIHRPYRTLNLDLNSKWQYRREDAAGSDTTDVPLLERAMNRDRRLRLFVGGGIFDLITPVLAASFGVDRMAVPRHRFTFATYEAGHSVFDHEASRVKLGHDIRAFISAGAAPAGVEPRSFSGYSMTTRHSGVFNGVRVDYAATFDDTVITNEKGEDTASLFATSYVRKNIAGEASRPVIFIWSGGPSASSQTLHMAGFGPRRLVVPADVTAAIGPPYETRDNVHTVLDVADLVFVDPAGTGFSRILPDGDESWFFSADGDAESVAQFIRKWLQKNDRSDSPVFVLGSSYGSIRAALVAGLLAASTKPLDGAILISQGVNLVETTQRSNNVMGYASNLSQQAAIAWYHGRTSLQDHPVSEVIDAAQEFAMGDYLAALVQGRFLPQADRRDIASRLAALTGVSSETYLAGNLMIRKTRYRRELLADQGLVLGATDARYTVPADSGQGPATLTQGVSEVQLGHMQNFLGITLPMDQYRGFAPGTGASWDYGGTSTIDGSALAPDSVRTVFADFDYPGAITPAFEANEKFRIMIATGIYDLLTTVGPARLLASNPDYPGDRVKMHDYPGGHAFYADDAAFERLADDIRRFVAGQHER